MRIEDLGEVELIKRIAQWVKTKDKDVILSIGDDAAVLSLSQDKHSIVTVDTLIEDIHFTTQTISPFDLGYKAIVVNVSDVAAMAGLPRFALICLGIPQGTEVGYVEEVYRGINQASKDYDLTVIGGDTTKSNQLTLAITIIGQVEPELLRRRGDARVGERIYVTGELGGSKAGLELILKADAAIDETSSSALKKAHYRPQARVLEARIASRNGAKALEDISDGLASEIFHICEQSQVGAKIVSEQIPLAAGVREVAELYKEDALDYAFFGGEDYELVFTALRDRGEEIRDKIVTETGTKVTDVGEIVSSSNGVVIESSGETNPLTQKGYEHFKS